LSRRDVIVARENHPLDPVTFFLSLPFFFFFFPFFPLLPFSLKIVKKNECTCTEKMVNSGVGEASLAFLSLPPFLSPLSPPPFFFSFLFSYGLECVAQEDDKWVVSCGFSFFSPLLPLFFFFLPSLSPPFPSPNEIGGRGRGERFFFTVALFSLFFSLPSFPPPPPPLFSFPRNRFHRWSGLPFFPFPFLFLFFLPFSPLRKSGEEIRPSLQTPPFPLLFPSSLPLIFSGFRRRKNTALFCYIVFFSQFLLFPLIIESKMKMNPLPFFFLSFFSHPLLR